jgi:tripartite-type tricarboxylate transporter receptor subunit TctC
MRVIGRLLAAIVFTALAMSSRGTALGFQPVKTVELVVHGGPAGGADLFARALADMAQKEKLVPQRLHVLNKSGGGSAVAMSYLWRKRTITTRSASLPASGAPTR